MKKIGLAVIAMLLIVPLANASMTRLQAMGVANWMVDDDANIWFSPAYINDYPNRIWADLGTGNAGLAANQWGGASLQILWGLLGNAGAFYTRPYTGLNGVSTVNLGTDPAGSDMTPIAAVVGNQVGYLGAVGVRPLATLAPANQLDLLFGLAIPSLLRLGISANYASNYTAYQNTRQSKLAKAAGDGWVRNEQSVQELNVGAGVTLSQLWIIPQIDIVLYAGLPMVNNTYRERAWVAAADATEDRVLTNYGAFNLLTGARAKLTLWNLKFLAYLGYGVNNLPSMYKEKQDANADGVLDHYLKQTREYNSTTVNAGLALNHQVTNKTLVVLALGAAYNVLVENGHESDPMAVLIGARNDFHSVQKTFGVPINIGIEHKLPWWELVGRAGLVVTYQIRITETVDPNYNPGGTETRRFTTVTPADITTPIAVSLGLGKEINDAVSVDLLLRQNANTGILNALTTQMSIVWKFK